MPHDRWARREEDRAPICAACGVTALPASPRHVVDPAFVCDNPDCEVYGEIVTSGTDP